MQYEGKISNQFRIKDIYYSFSKNKKLILFFVLAGSFLSLIYHLDFHLLRSRRAPRAAATARGRVGYTAVNLESLKLW